jgi:hypothetical protein
MTRDKDNKLLMAKKQKHNNVCFSFGLFFISGLKDYVFPWKQCLQMKTLMTF